MNNDDKDLSKHFSYQGEFFQCKYLTQVIFLFAKWKKIKPQVKLKEDSSKGYLKNYYVN